MICNRVWQMALAVRVKNLLTRQTMQVCDFHAVIWGGSFARSLQIWAFYKDDHSKFAVNESLTTRHKRRALSRSIRTVSRGFDGRSIICTIEIFENTQLPHPVEAVVRAVDREHWSARVSFCDASVPFEDDYLCPNFVVDLRPLV